MGGGLPITELNEKLKTTTRGRVGQIGSQVTDDGWGNNHYKRGRVQLHSPKLTSSCKNQRSKPTWSLISFHLHMQFHFVISSECNFTFLSSQKKFTIHWSTRVIETKTTMKKRIQWYSGYNCHKTIIIFKGTTTTRGVQLHSPKLTSSCKNQKSKPIWSSFQFQFHFMQFLYTVIQEDLPESLKQRQRCFMKIGYNEILDTFVRVSHRRKTCFYLGDAWQRWIFLETVTKRN